jgi:hypothetical protein
MSSFSKVTPLIELHTNSLDWTIKVRVVRMWTIQSSINPDKITEIQLILLDQEVRHNFFIFQFRLSFILFVLYNFVCDC